MNCRDAVVFALVVLLVLAVVYRSAAPCAASGGGGGAPRPGPGHGHPPHPPHPPHRLERFSAPPFPAPPGPPASHEEAHEADRAAWLAAGGEGAFDGAAAEGGAYSEAARDLVVDARMRENHERWVGEMKPWSGTATTVDDLDEASEASTHFLGLRRPQGGVAVRNPLQLNERDPSTFAGNKPFNFRG